MTTDNQSPKTPARKKPATAKGSAAPAQGAKTPRKTPAKGKVAPKARKPPSKPADAPVEVTQEEKRGVGRPTAYRPEFCQQLIDYFRIPVETAEDVSVPDGKGGMKVERIKVVNTFPTITRFADQLDVTRQTLHDWATAAHADGTLKHPEFSYAYARARDLQESLLVEGGMSGAYDSRFASLASKNLIGWRDQVEQKIEANVQMAKKEDLDAIYERGIKAAAEARQRALQRDLGGEVPGQGA